MQKCNFSFSMSLQRLNIAIVCDWLTNMGGAEKIILGLHQLFPKAPIYTTAYNPQKVFGFEDATIHTSYLQHVPGAKERHQFFLSFMPRIFENFDLSAYDIVISSSHSCAKGIITKPQTLHICYCHSPMRYAWDDNLNYIKNYDTPLLLKKIAPWVMHKIRLWDRLSADRVDHFIANSHFIQRRIHKYYRRPSSVIHPFVDLEKFQLGAQRQKYFLAVGRLTPHKKFDLLVDTFNQLGWPLKIVGTGVSAKRLKKMAASNIEFLDFVSDDTLALMYQKAAALIFPQVEDFGITPLEAMASGCPVIAYAQGGALETVVDNKTGILFHTQSPEALKQALYKFEKKRFDHRAIRTHAEKFSEQAFQEKILDYIEKKWKDWNKST